MSDLFEIRDGQGQAVPAAGAGGAGAPGRRPKVLFVLPRHEPSFSGFEFMGALGGFKTRNPPLGILTLAGAISPEYTVAVRDANVRPADYPTDADIVGISATLLHEVHYAEMAHLAAYFRSQGKLVAIGGPIANLSPAICRPHCDVLFEGEGERTWPQFLRDYENGCHKDHYVETEMIDLADAPMPRIDLIDPLDYANGLVQTSRGCPFSCEFCEIIVLFGRKVRTKPVGRVIAELERWAAAGQEHIFFADDNFVGNRVYAKTLLRELAVWNRARKHPLYFYTQASIDTARDDELLALLREANFGGIFIGIETPRVACLEETHKVQNVFAGDMIAAVRKIQSAGLQVSGGMIVGFDHDDPSIFKEQFDFLQEAGIVYTQASLLEAIPKTPLFARMHDEGRLVEYQEGLSALIRPLRMTYGQLIEGYTWLVQKLYSYDAYLERYANMLGAMRDCDFAMDRPAHSRRNWSGWFKTVNYFMFHKDRACRKFFWDMLRVTNEINPRAMPWTVRYLALFVHWHKFSNTYVMTVRKDIQRKLGAIARAS